MYREDLEVAKDEDANVIYLTFRKTKPGELVLTEEWWDDGSILVRFLQPSEEIVGITILL